MLLFFNYNNSYTKTPTHAHTPHTHTRTARLVVEDFFLHSVHTALAAQPFTGLITLT